MIRTIPKSDLGAMVGQIYTGKRDNQFKNVVIGYVCGNIPIKIETNLNQEQWNRFCDGELSMWELESLIF